MTNKSHPWGAFLNARFRAILWMQKHMGYNDLEIAKKLSMDEMQVYLIRTSTIMPIPEGTYKEDNDPDITRQLDTNFPTDC